MKRALNLACGRNTIQSTKEIEWTNVDSYERENKLDLIVDVTKHWFFDDDSYDYIYAEQFIEHLNWLDGLKFLRNCFKSLKKDGILRLVLPHYKKIFQKYLEGDKEFFEVFFEALNKSDLPYYCSVYQNPEKVRKERKNNLPPDWHTSSRLRDRKRLELRLRTYRYPIEIVDYFCHQYFEHKCLWDYTSLRGHLLEIGFSNVKSTNIKDIDSHAITRIDSSLFLEGIK